MSFYVTKTTPVQDDALRFLQHPSDVDHIPVAPSGAFLSNQINTWFANGPKLVVANSKVNRNINLWDFRCTLGDNNVEIVAVDEIRRTNGREPLLAIALNCESIGGAICIFDFIWLKVIRIIRFGDFLSSVHVINGGQDVFNSSGPLEVFDGVLTVGTVGGNIYLVDMCKELTFDNPNEKLFQLHVITLGGLRDMEMNKKIALDNDQHLAIHLNPPSMENDHRFEFKEPTGRLVAYILKEETKVSALHYCPQLGSILVGFNFGGFQLWNVLQMKLIYTSKICEDQIPVTKFAVQEPVDDPRAFCFIWVVYSCDDLESPYLPYLVMYALAYESKEYHECYGTLYENFRYCVVNFHTELGFNGISTVGHRGGACLRLETMTHKNSSSSYGFGVSDATEDVLSVCVVAWRCVSESGDYTFVMVFDLNQWYKAQMPSEPNFEDCNYTMVVSLIDFVQSDCILDLMVAKKSLRQFSGMQKYEEHFYPSALSFDLCILMPDKVIELKYRGVQHQLLHQLQAAGPLCLIRPTEIYEGIISFGLDPLFVELGSGPISLNTQREIILSVALEQQMTDWLFKCATEWANGSLSSAGCSLDLLLNWAFNRAMNLKKNCDDLCVPLFNHFGTRLDANNNKILNNCIRQINNLSSFYLFVLKNLASYVGNKEILSEQCCILDMLKMYYHVLQWLYNIGLLPEHSPTSIKLIADEDKIRVPYPFQELLRYYETRRAELHLLRNTVPLQSEPSFLFIDNLIEIECNGAKLSEEWRKDGGDGFYPPKSLQALLRTYLVDGANVTDKHVAVIYLFLDLAMILQKTQHYNPVVTQLIKFPAVFKVTPSVIKITQAFWQLDHGDFTTAMEQLLDPMVNQDDLKSWHHKVAMRSLIVQKQYNYALRYLRLRKPSIDDEEDVLCALHLYVANDMLDEAFYLKRNYGSEKIARFLISECGQRGVLSKLIHRNLSLDEERVLLRYLDEVQHPDTMELKVAYFFQRGHYLEACKLRSDFNKGLVGQAKLATHDKIVASFKKFLPPIGYKVIESCMKEPNAVIKKEAKKSEPLSMFVKKTEEKPEYKSSLIYAAMVKAKQTTNGSCDLMNVTTEEIPFLRTSTRLASTKRPIVPVLTPKVAEAEDCFSPRKKRRLDTSAVLNTSRSFNNSLLNTPLVKRKVVESARTEKILETPVSILKTRVASETPLREEKQSTSTPNVRFKMSSPENEARLSARKSYKSDTERATIRTSPRLSGRRQSAEPDLKLTSLSSAGRILENSRIARSSLSIEKENISEVISRRDEEIETPKGIESKQSLKIETIVYRSSETVNEENETPIRSSPRLRSLTPRKSIRRRVLERNVEESKQTSISNDENIKSPLPTSRMSLERPLLESLVPSSEGKSMSDDNLLPDSQAGTSAILNVTSKTLTPEKSPSHAAPSSKEAPNVSLNITSKLPSPRKSIRRSLLESSFSVEREHADLSEKYLTSAEKNLTDDQYTTPVISDSELLRTQDYYESFAKSNLQLEETLSDDGFYTPRISDESNDSKTDNIENQVPLPSNTEVQLASNIEIGETQVPLSSNTEIVDVSENQVPLVFNIEFGEISANKSASVIEIIDTSLKSNIEVADISENQVETLEISVIHQHSNSSSEDGFVTIREDAIEEIIQINDETTNEDKIESRPPSEASLSEDIFARTETNLNKEQQTNPTLSACQSEASLSEDIFTTNINEETNLMNVYTSMKQNETTVFNRAFLEDSNNSSDGTLNRAMLKDSKTSGVFEIIEISTDIDNSNLESKQKSIPTPVRRSTRRSSQIEEQQHKDEVPKEKVSVTPLRRLTRRLSQSLEQEAKEATPPNPISAKSEIRTRSMSEEPRATKRKLRSASVEVETPVSPVAARTRKRASSVSSTLSDIDKRKRKTENTKKKEKGEPSSSTSRTRSTRSKTPDVATKTDSKKGKSKKLQKIVEED